MLGNLRRETLRPYQERGIYDIFNQWRLGKRSVLFQMPTGTGKTVLFVEIVHKGHQQDRNILIVVHRRELINQIVGKLKSRGIEPGIIMAGEKPDYSKIVQVASVLTLNNREIHAPNLIIVDECHHAKADTYKRLWTKYPDAKILGVTATPVRLNGEGFDNLFDVLIPTMQIQDFIEQGYLSKVEHLVGATPDLTGVKKSNGDYAVDTLSKVMLNSDLMADVVESYQEKANGKSTIVFAVNVAHSKEIVQRFKDEGIKAAHIDSDTPLGMRDDLLTKFKQGEIKVMSNVEIITEGFDFPECEAVVLARPTKSLALYLQMIGRVMRPAPGKEKGLILDNAGLWMEHGLATVSRSWSLKGKPKKKKKDEDDYDELLGLDEEGIIREVVRTRPQEIKGLTLIEMKADLRCLLDFENIVREVIANHYKPLSAWFKYKEIIEYEERKVTKTEMNYINKRLSQLNKQASKDKQFKPGALWYEIEDLKLKGLMDR